MIMKKNKVIGIIAIVCLLFSIYCPVVASAEDNTYKNVTLTMYSNLIDDSTISGLYKDNAFYITVDNMCSLSGYVKKETTADTITISSKYDTRTFVLDTKNNTISENLVYTDYLLDVPVVVQNEKVYISIAFLKYIGATVKLDENSPIQFMVVTRYSIFDALGEFHNIDNGNFFWWDEVDSGKEDLEDKLVNAGIVALINRDSNIFRMAIDAKGIQREALEDTLVSIVKNEGVDYIEEQDEDLEAINFSSDAIGVDADWLGVIMESYGTDKSEYDELFNNKVSNLSTAAGITKNTLNAIESLKQFDNMTDTQRVLLQNTILKYSDKSNTISDGWDVLLQAAQNVDGKVQSEYKANISAASDAIRATAYDFINGIGEGNPVHVAWNSAILITKSIPFTSNLIDKKTQLYQSYNSSIIQLVANEILVQSYSDLYYNDFYMNQPEKQTELLRDVKNAMIFQLKSTLTTREYLIKSGYLSSDYKANMEKMNIEIANLLNKVENCEIVKMNACDEGGLGDISWIAKQETTNEMYSSILQQYQVLMNNDYYKTLEEQNRNGQFNLDLIGKDVNINVLYEPLWSGVPANPTNPHLYYALSDLNNDGIDELFISGNYEYVNDGFVSEPFIYDIFSYDGEKTIKLFNENFHARSRCIVYSNNIIQHSGSGGASYSSNTFYEFSSNSYKPILKEEIGLSGSDFYHKTADGVETKITEQEFYSVIDSYKTTVKEFEWIEIVSQ